MSLGPTNNKGVVMDSDGVNTLITGGALSSKDKAPLSSGSEGGQQITHSQPDSGHGEHGEQVYPSPGNKDDITDEEKDDDSVGSGIKSVDSTPDKALDGGDVNEDGPLEDQRPVHDEADPTPPSHPPPSPRLGPEVIENKASDDNWRSPPTNEVLLRPNLNKEPTDRTENNIPTISPTPSQITRHPGHGNGIRTTNMDKNEEEEAESATAGSNVHVSSSASSIVTNEEQQANTASGFDDTDVANGTQLATAGDKLPGSIGEMDAEDLRRILSNSTIDVRPDDDDVASIVESVASGDAVRVFDGHQTESQDTAISRGTDSPSRQPAVQDGDVPTQNIQGTGDVRAHLSLIHI